MRRHMLRSLLVAVAAVAFVPTIAAAQSTDPIAVAKSVSPAVPEMVTGGSWSVDGKGGLVRALVVIAGDPKDPTANVFLQWLAFEAGKAPIIIATTPIKEFNSQKLQNAFIAAESEKEDEVLVAVSSYDVAEDKDVLIKLKPGGPGKYTIVPNKK